MSGELKKLRKKIALLIAPLALGVGSSFGGISAKEGKSPEVVGSENVSLNGYGGIVGAGIGTAISIIHDVIKDNYLTESSVYSKSIAGKVSFGLKLAPFVGAIIGETVSNYRRPGVAELTKQKNEKEEKEQIRSQRYKTGKLARFYLDSLLKISNYTDGRKLSLESKKAVKKKLGDWKLELAPYGQFVPKCQELLNWQKGMLSGEDYVNLDPKISQSLDMFIAESFSSEECSSLIKTLEPVCEDCKKVISKIEDYISNKENKEKKIEKSDANLTNSKPDEQVNVAKS